MRADPVDRPGVRVLLLDPDDRVLLIKIEDPRTDLPVVWIAPGGAIEDGEDPDDAARREVAEETGLLEFDLGPWVWRRRFLWRLNSTWYASDERYYVSRVEPFDAVPQALEPFEDAVITDYRWWSADEIDDHHEPFSPEGLGDLLRELLDDGAPARPVLLDG